MTRLPRVGARKALAALGRAGFREVRSKGSHRALERADDQRTVIVPVHGNRDIPPGTLRAILDQAGLTVDEFIELLRD